MTGVQATLSEMRTFVAAENAKSFEMIKRFKESQTFSRVYFLYSE